METCFQKPAGLIGRFAIVKLWPGVQAAEDENIARLKRTAQSLGLQCIEITPDGRRLDSPDTRVTQADVDFVIHLHFETPKAYDIFSFVALWNPEQFLHDWGYRRFSRHLLTHDDFLSCSSTGADDQILRMIASDPTRVGPYFTMYHSLSEPILEPSLGERKIFYVGINWERLGKKRGRHQDLLDALDKTGRLCIYGPRTFQNVDVWKGYDSYVGPIEFDGISIIPEIHRCGISLVLSSDAHKESELMSNRLFESLAAGAIVICDENPFGRRYFDDSLLYIDGGCPADEVLEAVMTHVRWIDAHPQQALEMARRSQAIFRETFALDISLKRIYTEFNHRKLELQNLYAPMDSQQPVWLFLLMPSFDSTVLQRHLQSVRTQRYASVRAVLIVNEKDYADARKEIDHAIEQSGVAITLRPTAFACFDTKGRQRKRRRLGEIFCELLDSVAPEYLFSFVAPDEELFCNHVESLVGAIQRAPDAAVAHSHLLYRHRNDGVTYHDLQEDIQHLTPAAHRPLGYGRFLFRRSAIPAQISSALYYTDGLSIALLLLACSIRVPSRRASLISDVQSDFNLNFATKTPKEIEVLRDRCPLPADRSLLNGHSLDEDDLWEPSSLSLKRLSENNRKDLAVDLAHSVPIPTFLKRILFGGYRLWLHRTR